MLLENLFTTRKRWLIPAVYPFSYHFNLQQADGTSLAVNVIFVLFFF